jgi:hypothetical protein
MKNHGDEEKSSDKQKGGYDSFHETIESLALDPSRGLKLQAGGVEEAMVALQAENLEVFERLEREETGGAEFADEQGVEWDVKSPLSPSLDNNWKYSPRHQLKKVRRDFSQGDKVLLNLTRVNDNDRDQTIQVLHDSLSCSERENLLILSNVTGLISNTEGSPQAEVANSPAIR